MRSRPLTHVRPRRRFLVVHLEHSLSDSHSSLSSEAQLDVYILLNCFVYSKI